LKITAFLVLTLAVLGCQTYTPVVDPGSVRNDDRYYRDQAECKAIAKQGAPGWKDTAKDTAIGGGVGAGTGALIGAIAGNAGAGLAYGAVIGGVAGGAKGIYSSEKGFNEIYRNCMRGRGYNVLN
jgi:outer membrane lipoprotein SlyB